MSERLTRFFASRCGVILAGAVIVILAPLLQKLGNPPNMGICVACFKRDIAGALGLHRVAVVQYVRPEIIGFVLGALMAAYLFGEFKARAGSVPIVCFVQGSGVPHRGVGRDRHVARERAARLGEDGLCGRGGGAGRRVQANSHPATPDAGRGTKVALFVVRLSSFVPLLSAGHLSIGPRNIKPCHRLWRLGI
jgi:hypothetical protein